MREQIQAAAGVCPHPNNYPQLHTGRTHGLIGPARPRIRNGILGAVFVALALGHADAQTAPSNLKVNSAVTPMQVITSRPTFSWTVTGGTETAYQIQVSNHCGACTSDQDDWNNGSCTWFWDSGEITASSTSIQYPDTTYIGTCSGQSATVASQQLHRAPIRIHWRVRIKQGGAFSAWTASYFEMNRPPDPPTNLGLSSGSGGGANVVGTLTTGTTRTVGAGQTYSTIAAALSAASCGDTVEVHADSSGGSKTYNEEICVSDVATSVPGHVCSYQTHAQCGVNNPLRIIAATGDTITLTYGGPNAVILIPGISPYSKYVSVEGFHLDGTANRHGVEIGDSVNHVRVQGLYFADTFGFITSKAYDDIKSAGTQIVVSGCRVHSSTSSAIFAAAAFETTADADNWIVGNEIDGNATRGIEFHGGGFGKGEVITNNYIHISGPTATDEDPLNFYYGSGHLRFERNIVVSDQNVSRGVVLIQRDGRSVFENNLFRFTGSSGNNLVFDNFDSGAYMTVRNNIFLNSTSAGTIYGSTVGFPAAEGPKPKNYSPAGSPSGGSWTIDYNLYYNIATIVDSAVSGALTRGSHECDSCNPHLNSNGNGTENEVVDFNPTSSSTNVIDHGVGKVIPVSGGSAVDIGRFEYGASSISNTGSYSYQPLLSTNSVTPDVMWTFNDLDNTRAGSPVATQGAYRILIDNVPTMDSGGAFRPLIDSGVVTTSNGATVYKVPSGILSNGTTYYVAIVNADNAETGAVGTWSDWNAAFTYAAGGNPGGPACPFQFEHDKSLCVNDLPCHNTAGTAFASCLTSNGVVNSVDFKGVALYDNPSQGYPNAFEFLIHNTSGGALNRYLTILNGANSTYRVTSADLKLNGTVIFSNSDVNSGTGWTQAQITLPTGWSTVHVDNTTDSWGELSVFITDQSIVP